MEQLGDFNQIASVAGQAFHAFNFLKRNISEAGVISALFDSGGVRIGGSEFIAVERHTFDGDDSAWFYSVEPVDGYIFQRFPTSESGIAEVLGTPMDTANPDANYWRWVAMGLPGRIYGGGEGPNALVGFVVIGYRPQALLDYFDGT